MAKVFWMPSREENKAVFRNWDTAEVIDNFEGEFTYYPADHTLTSGQMFTWFEKNETGKTERAFSTFTKEEYAQRFPDMFHPV